VALVVERFGATAVCPVPRVRRGRRLRVRRVRRPVRPRLVDAGGAGADSSSPP